MVRRPLEFRENSRLQKLFNSRSLFNKLLCEAIAEYEQHVLGIESCAARDSFDSFGELNSRGKNLYWHEMDDLLHKFDTKKIQLLPRVNKKKSSFRQGKNWQRKHKDSRSRSRSCDEY